MRIFILLTLFLSNLFYSQKTGRVTVQYKNTNEKNDKLSLDIYPLKNEHNRPVVIFVHGGAWILGDKATKIDNKVRLFQEKNYVFVSVNYRLSSFFSKSLQYPEHPNDVADAVLWIKDHISEYGGDPQNMVLMGHSAGAQIVSLLGTSDHFLPKRNIALDELKGIISIDTEGYDVEGMGNSNVKIYRRIFGDDPVLWKEASPMASIQPGKTYPKFLVATRGENYRKEMSQRFVTALQNAGAEAKLINVDPYSHFASNNKIGTAGEQIITPEILGFLRGCFGE